MTLEQIIEIGRQSGMVGTRRGWVLWDLELEKFASAVAAAEREACAQLAAETVCDVHIPTGVKIYGTRAAEAIRKRGAQ